jgi:CBS domain-containing protein
VTSLASIGQRRLVTVPPQASVAEIARRMAERNVGSVVVTERDRPVGIVTDRDLVLRVLRNGLPTADLRAEHVMTKPLISVPAETTAEEAVSRMREARVRRLPIVDAQGLLVGIVCLDDLVHHVGRTQAEMAATVSRLPGLEVGA